MSFLTKQDLEGTGASMTTKVAEDPFVHQDMIQFMAQQYLGDRDRRMPLASPLYADLHGLPPLLIQVGSAEVLLDDATRIADRAKAAGVQADLEVWDDMIHIWQIFAPVLPEGQHAIERLGGFIREHMR
jgi:monoterpene epsilon-lactone hydrolase